MVTVTATLKKYKTCKHSIRYNAIDDESQEVVSAIYLRNDAVEKLSRPETISITITSTND